MNYESYDIAPSKLRHGVTYVLNRMSFGRRIELMGRVRELAPRLECYEAGSSKTDQIEAAILSAEINLLYLTWGLTRIEGLEIDGTPAGPAELVNRGPEDLCLEALTLVKAACRLSEAEIKN